MADLGHLRLHLSASLGQLRSDLNQAKQLAKNTHSEIQASLGGSIDWGLTKGLNRELITAETMLSGSLNRMEAMGRRGIKIRVAVDERSLTDAVVEIHSAIPDVGLKVKLDKRSLTDAVVEIHSAVSHIANESIKIKVDDSALTRLNAHYKLKWADHDETVRRLAKPIMLHVDDSELRKHQGTKQNLHQKIIVSLDRGEIDKLGSDIGRSIGKAINLGSSSGISSAVKGLKNIAVAPIKVGFELAAFPLRELAKGALQGLGRDLSQGLSQSFAGAINNSLSGSIGSLDLVGRKIGEAGTREVKRAYTSYTADRPELKQSIDATGIAARSFLGEKDVAIEANKGRGRQQAKQRQDLSLAQNGVIAEIRASEVELNRAESSYVNAVRALKSEIDVVTKEQIADQAKYQQIAKLRKSNRLTPARAAVVEQSQQKLTARQDARSTQQGAINDLLEPRAADVLIAQQRKDVALQQFQALQRAPRPKAYQDLLDQIAPGLPDHLVPELAPRNFAKGKDGRTTYASYSSLHNKIEVNPELYRKIQKGKLDRKSTADLAEEIRHAEDFEFGQARGVQANGEKRLLKKPVTATIAEEKAIAGNLLGYSPEVRAIERNAKIKANRDTDKYLQQQAVQGLTAQVGPGGLFMQAVSGERLGGVQQRLDNRSSLAKEFGKKIPSLNKLEQELSRVRAVETGLIDRITVAQTGGSSAEEIAQLQVEVQSHLKSIDSIDRRVSAAGRAIPKARSSGAKSSAITLNQVGETVAAIGSSARQIADKVTPVVQGAMAIAQQAYGVLEGAEGVMLGVLPGGKTAKKVMQKTAVPAAIYAAATHSLPGAPMIAHGFQTATQSMLSLPASGITGALDGVIAGSVGNLPGIGSAVSTAVSSLSGGIVDLAVSSAAGVMAPILGGAAIQKVGGNALKAIAPSSDTSKAKRIGQGAAERVRDSFEVTISPLDELLPESKPQAALAPAKASLKRVGNKEVLQRLDKNLRTFRDLEKKLQKDLDAGVLSHPESLQRVADSIKEQADSYKDTLASLQADPERKGIANKLINRKGQFTRINNDIQRSLTVARNRNKSIESNYESYSKEGGVDEQLAAMKAALNPVESADSIDLAALKSEPKRLSSIDIFKATYGVGHRRGVAALRQTRKSRKGLPGNEIFDPEIVKAQNLNDRLATKVEEFEQSAQAIGERAGDPDAALYKIRGVGRRQANAQARGLTPEILTAQNIASRSQQNISRYDRAAAQIEAPGFTTTPRSPLQKAFSAVSAPLDLANKGFEKLQDNFVNLAAAGGGLFALAGITAVVASWGVASVRTAAQLQDLKTAFDAVTTSSPKAAIAIQRSTATADKFGYNKLQSLQSDASFLAATKNTGVELVAQDISDGLTQYSRVLGVSADRLQLGKLGLQQAAGKGQLNAEDVFGQIAESIPGAANILASSNGQTVAQLRKKIESGSINSNDALPRFGAALAAESSAQAGTASRSTSASIGRLGNSITDLQAATGDQLIVPATAGLEAAATGAKLLADNLGIVSTIGVSALAATGLQAIGLDNIFRGISSTVRGVGAAIGNFSQAPLSSLSALKNSAKEAGASIAPLASTLGLTAALTLGVGAFQSLSDTLSNTSPMREAAVQMQALAATTNQAAEAAKNLQSEKYNKDRNIFELASDAVNAPFRGLGVKIETVAESKSAIDIENIKRGQTASTVAIGKNSLGVSRANQDDLDATERELRSVRARKSVLTAVDRDELTQVDRQEQELILRRKQLEQPVFDQKANLRASIKFNQSILDDPAYRANPELSGERRQATINIANAETAIAKLDKTASKSSESLDRAKIGLEQLSNELSNITANTQRARTVGLTAVEQRSALINPLDTGGKQGETFKVNQRAISDELNALKTAIAKATAEINQPIFQEQLSTFKKTGKLPENLQNTSDEQFQELEKLKASPELIALIKKVKAAKDRIDSLNQESAGQIAEYQRAVAENAKSAREYYRAATEQFQKSAIDAQSARQSIVSADLGSRYKTAIQGVGGSLTGFITAMTDAMLEMRSITQIELDRRKKDFELQGQKIQQQERYRSEISGYTKSEILPDAEAEAGAITSPLPGIASDRLAAGRYDPSTKLGANRRNQATGRHYAHQGQDFGSQFGIVAGSPIVAPISGTAKIVNVASKGRSTYGVSVVIESPDGLTSKSTHLTAASAEQALGIKTGSGSTQVRAGQRIGAITALRLGGTEDHLHQEFWRNGQPIDPLKVFRGARLSSQNKSSSASGSNTSGINPRLMGAVLDYIGQRESGNNYYAKNDGGSFPQSEAARGFPASQSVKQPVKTKNGIKYIMPNVGRYQFNLGDYNLARRIDPTITNFLPENQDKIAKIKIERLGRGGKELLNFQQNPTLANVEKVRKGVGNEWQIFHKGDEPGATSSYNYWHRNGNNNEKFFDYLRPFAGSQQSSGAKSTIQTIKPAKRGVNNIDQIANGAGYLEKYTDTNSQLITVNGQRVAKDAAVAFEQMQAAASKEKIRLRVISGYRSTKDQKATFDRKGGGAAATKYSAPPGYSQHHTGLAIDINSVESNFAKSREYAWLQKNAANYGFIKPYGNASGDLGPENEPWHWAFAGNERSMQQFRPFIRRAKGIGYDPLIGNQRLQNLYGQNSVTTKSKKLKGSNQALLPGKKSEFLLAYDPSIISDSGNLFTGALAQNDPNARGFGNNSASGYNWGGKFTAPALDKNILPSRGGIGSFGDSIQNLNLTSPKVRSFVAPAPVILPLPIVKKRKPATTPSPSIVVPNVYAPGLAPLPSKAKKRRQGVSADTDSEPIRELNPLQSSLSDEFFPGERYNKKAEISKPPGSGANDQENIRLAGDANQQIQQSLDEQRKINNEQAIASTRNAKRSALARVKQAERDRLVAERTEEDRQRDLKRQSERDTDPVGYDTPQKQKRIADRERKFAGQDRKLKLQREIADLSETIKAVEEWEKESKSTPDKDLLPEEIKIRDRIQVVVKNKLPIIKNRLREIKGKGGLLELAEKATVALQDDADSKSAQENQDRRITALSGTRTATVAELTEKKKKAEVHLQSYPLDYKTAGDPLDYQKQIEVLGAKNTYESERQRIEKSKREDPFNTAEFDKQLKTAEAAYQLAQKNAVATYHSQFKLRKLATDDNQLGLAIRKDQGVSESLGLRISAQGIRDRQDAPYANNALIQTQQEKDLLDELISRNRILADIEKERRQYAGNKDVLAALDIVKSNTISNSVAKQELIIQQYTAETEARDRERKKSLYERSDRIQASGFAVQQANIDGRQALGVSPREESYKLQVDRQSNHYDQQVRNLELEKSAITGTSEQAAFARREISALITDMERLKSIELGNLAKQFDPLNQALNAVQKTTRGVFEEFVKTGKFDIGSILKSGIDSLLGKTLDRLTTDLFSNLYRGAGAAGTNPAKGASGGGGVGSLIGSVLGGLLGFAEGGDIIASGLEGKLAMDESIAAGLRREEAKSGGKGTLIFATIGETMLTREESSVYRSMFPNGIIGHATGGDIGKIPPQNKINLPPLQNSLTPITLPKLQLPNLGQNVSNFSNSNVSSSVTVNNTGGTPQAQGDGSQFGELLGAAIVQKIIELQRQGLVPRPS